MRFLCDEMLRGLARWLRAAGYDTEVARAGQTDRELLAEALRDSRFLLTRDRKLTEFRRAEQAVVWLNCNTVDQCAHALSAAVAIDWLKAPFSRCTVCNEPLQLAPVDDLAQVPPGSREHATQVWRCPRCNKLYWDGSHVTRMRNTLERWQTDRRR